MTNRFTQGLGMRTTLLTRRRAIAAVFGALVVGLQGPDRAGAKRRKKRPSTVCANGCKYTTLAAAIAGTRAGGTICLKNGEYTENLTITKRLTITPCGPSDVVVIQTSQELAGRTFTVQFGSDADSLTFRAKTLGNLTLKGAAGAFPEAGGVIGFGVDTPSTPSKGNLVLENVVMQSGNAGKGGAIAANTSGEVRLTNTLIQQCSCILNPGGAIAMAGGTLTVGGSSQIRDCIAPNGGGIGLSDGAQLILSGTAVVGGPAGVDANRATSDFGGGVYAAAGTQVTMSGDATIQKNQGYTAGGGIYAEQDALLLGNANCASGKIFENVLGYGSSGAQIYLANSANIC